MNINSTQIKTLEESDIIPKGTPKAQVEIFIQVCEDNQISPFSKEVHLSKYGDSSYSVIIGIGGYRRIAARNNLAGMDEPTYNEAKTLDQCLAEGIKTPRSCSMTVYRIVNGIRVPYTHTVSFQEFSSGKMKWKSMPFQMIAKVAESFALRKGFSDVARGLNIAEEMAAFSDINNVEVTKKDIDQSVVNETRKLFATAIEKVGQISNEKIKADMSSKIKQIKNDAIAKTIDEEQFTSKTNELIIEVQTIIDAQ